MDKIKAELTAVTEKYINKLSDKTLNQNNLDKLAIRTSFGSENLSKLTGELIDVANKFMADKNIESTDESEELIKNNIKVFSRFCLTGSL